MTNLVFETGWGWCGVAASDRGLVRVILPQKEPQRVREKLGPPTGVSGPLVEVAAREIREYLHGQRREFTIPVDLELLSDFARQTLSACREIRWGTTVSYGELAGRVGRPGAARAVGQVMAANPVPLVVPCHRVIRADGSLGGFGSGPALKRRLLKLEAGACTKPKN